MSDVADYDREELLRYIWHSRKIGFSWDKIADSVNSDYHTSFGPREIAAMYRVYMADLNDVYGPEERTQDLGMEIARLDELQAAWYEAAMVDEKAATLVLNLMKQRHRLKGLDAMDISDRNMVANVLVIGDDKQQWIEALAQGKNRGEIMPGPVGEDRGE